MKRHNNIYKNGGFPPIKYCPELDKEKNTSNKPKQERFFANAPKQNINIRQLLVDSNKKPIIIADNTDNVIEEVSEL
jgi:hypothetical protein